jgi:hypothetical protein
MVKKTYRRNFSAFDRPYQNDPFVKRARIAKEWIIAAGCTHLMRIITKGANEFAGSDHEAFLAYVSWRIKAWEVEQAAKKVARNS